MQQDLRRSVPPCGHVVGVRRLGSDFLGETEISNFDMAVVKQEVLWFQIPVKNTVAVHVVEAHQSLVKHALYLVLAQPSGLVVLDHVEHVALHELEDQVQVIVHANDFFQLHYVGVVELPQGLDLPQAHALIPGKVLLLHFLDGHDLSVLVVGGFGYCSVSAVAEVLCDLVFIHFLI